MVLIMALWALIIYNHLEATTLKLRQNLKAIFFFHHVIDQSTLCEKKKLSTNNIVNGHRFHSQERDPTVDDEQTTGPLTPSAGYLLCSDHGKYLYREITHSTIMTLLKPIGTAENIDIINSVLKMQKNTESFKRIFCFFWPQSTTFIRCLNGLLKTYFL